MKILLMLLAVCGLACSPEKMQECEEWAECLDPDAYPTLNLSYEPCPDYICGPCSEGRVCGMW